VQRPSPVPMPYSKLPRTHHRRPIDTQVRATCGRRAPSCVHVHPASIVCSHHDCMRRNKAYKMQRQRFLQGPDDDILAKLDGLLLLLDVAKFVGVNKQGFHSLRDQHLSLQFSEGLSDLIISADKGTVNHSWGPASIFSGMYPAFGRMTIRCSFQDVDLFPADEPRCPFGVSHHSPIGMAVRRRQAFVARFENLDFGVVARLRTVH